MFALIKLKDSNNYLKIITDQNGRLIRIVDFKLAHDILTIPLGTPNIPYNILNIPQLREH